MRGACWVVIVDPGVAVSGEATEDDPADAVVVEIEATGGEAMAGKSSVSEWADGEKIVRDTVDRFGRLDAVINNAGILRDRMITSMTESDFDDVIAVHLKGTFQMTKHACDHWRAVAKAGGTNAGGSSTRRPGLVSVGTWVRRADSAAKAGIAALTWSPRSRWRVTT